MPFTLVLGGARSGKTRWALARAEALPSRGKSRLVMIATAEALDAEMAERIARHRAERDSRWMTVEAPTALAEAIGAMGAGDIAVVDCLTLWLSNLMLANTPLPEAFDRLEDACASSPAQLILISNEVGQGVVPDNPLARRFRDEAGRLHQRLAARADRVLMVVAGLPLWLKGGD